MAINLLPASERQKRKAYLLNYYTLVGGIVLVAGSLVLAVLLLLFSQVYRLNLDAAKAQKAQAESQAALYLDTEKKAADLSKQLENLKRAQNQTTHWSAILTDLQAFTPPNVSVKSITIKPAGAAQQGGTNRAEIQGVADSRRSAAQFQVALAGSKNFRNVEMEVTTASTPTGPVEYKITLEVNYDKLNGPLK